MKPLFKSCYELDKRCYDEYNLTEDILMEHASIGMERYIREHFKRDSSVLIVCGVGNNGADGITLARLIESDYRVMLYIPFGVKSKMAQLQLKRVEALGGVEIVSDVKEADIIVDAIFGAGLSRELDEKTRELIVKLEALDGFKIACDIPTGIDINGNPSPMAFIADVTITMGALKEALYSDMAKDFVGEIICVDLGVSFKKYTQGFETDIYLLEESDFRPPRRDFFKNTHKGTFGHLAVIIGERDGAGVLCASSALRFGAGLVSVVGEMYCSVPPTIMHDLDIPPKTTAIAFGMGFGDDFEDEIVDEILEHKAPIVLDADIFKSERVLEFLEQKDREIVLTPHPREFVSLWNISIEESIDISYLQANRFDKVREFCLLFPHVTLLLKGANMIIAQNDKLFVNPFGTPKLSKGGSGDVLAGLIGALLAQGWSGLPSAINASMALAFSASLYKGADFSMLPTDLIDNLSKL